MCRKLMLKRGVGTNYMVGAGYTLYGNILSVAKALCVK